MTFLLASATIGPAGASGGELDTLDGAGIREALAGNTVVGAMASGDDYAEFYAEDGTIRGENYTGEWTIDGDRMCFAYGGEPTCYLVAVDGRSVTWILDGEPDGTGTVRDGNPLDF